MKGYKRLNQFEINQLTKDVKKLDNEKFKQIIFDSCYSPYLISTHGRVFSLNYMHQRGNVRQLRTSIDKDGYELIIINYNKKTYGFGIHRLVALHFIPNFDEYKTQVNHKDCNKLNNHYSNLEWTTPKENIDHAWRHNLSHSFGIQNGRNKYTEEQITDVCKMIEDNFSFGKIHEITSVSYAIISLIYRKKNWTHISDKFDFSNYNYGHIK